MLLLDRYLLRQFLSVFAIAFCSLAGLYIVADALGHLEEFVTQAGDSLIATMAEYYGYRTIAFFDRTSGILTLIAAMFTLASFQRHNEMTAVEAAGISKWRTVRPIILAVVAISLFAAASRELVIPQFRDKFSRSAQDLAADSTKRLAPRYDNNDVFINGRQLRTNQQRIDDPTFRLPPELAHYGRYLVGKTATYQTATDDRPAGFLFENVSQPQSLPAKPSLRLASGEPVLMTPHDTTWLKANECFLVSGVAFDQLVDAASWRQYSSTADLIAGLYNRSLDFGADVRVTIHSRLVQPVLDVTLLFLGMPLLLRRGNRNVFLAIGLCLLVVIGFLLVVMSCQYLGTSILVTPVMAVWAPLFVFVPLAAWISEPVWE
ncbi:MAG: LptF/LptG family permease [Pirellulales bacterium]